MPLDKVDTNVCSSRFWPVLSTHKSGSSHTKRPDTCSGGRAHSVKTRLNLIWPFFRKVVWPEVFCCTQKIKPNWCSGDQALSDKHVWTSIWPTIRQHQNSGILRHTRNSKYEQIISKSNSRHSPDLIHLWHKLYLDKFRLKCRPPQWSLK